MQHYQNGSNRHIVSRSGTIEHVHIGKNSSIDEIEEYRALFKELSETFLPCHYEEMLGIESIYRGP